MLMNMFGGLGTGGLGVPNRSNGYFYLLLSFFHFSLSFPLTQRFFNFTLDVCCSAPRGIICYSANAVTRNGFLWHSRKYPGTDCLRWQCSCCCRATSWKSWTIVLVFSSIRQHYWWGLMKLIDFGHKERQRQILFEINIKDFNFWANVSSFVPPYSVFTWTKVNWWKI